MLLLNDLETLFSLPVSIKDTESPSGLISLLSARKMVLIKVGTVEFLGITPFESETFSAVVLKKQLDKYKEASGKNCAFIIKNPSKLQIDALIKNHIPFIAEGKQIYLPFFGIMLSDDLSKSKQIDSEKMMPASQELFLYMFYNSEHKYFLKSDVAEKLNLTRTSLTRASDQLIAMNLIKQEKVGKEYRMELTSKSSALYKASKDFLISPIFKEFYIDSKQLPEDALHAGETALAECSMMGFPRIPEYAIDKNHPVVKNLKPVDIRWEDCNEPVKIQLWKYNPSLFGKENRVDTVSMICSLADFYDERIEGEIEDIIGEERW